MRRVIILGSTGSIGTQALEVIAANPDRFQLVGLAAGQNKELLDQQSSEFGGVRAVQGAEAATRLVEETDADVVVNGITGSIGLAPTLATLKTGKTLALANKESLIVGGRLVTEAAAPGQIVPVDSEHSAIFQSLPEDASTWDARVEKIILTASGGPFRTRDLATLKDVTPEQACAHPNWVMGRKISVDSATMMNKALEVIEARYLFGLPPERLEVVIHPQSVIHSMVQYRDTSVVAQLGTPDMRVPIAYGLSWPERMNSGAQALDFQTLADMSFESLDSHGHRERFAGLSLAWDALRAPLGTTAVLNATNEVAVEAFLSKRIRFDQIHHVNAHCLSTQLDSNMSTIEDLLGLDERTRALAHACVNGL